MVFVFFTIIVKSRALLVLHENYDNSAIVTVNIILIQYNLLFCQIKKHLVCHIYADKCHEQPQKCGREVLHPAELVNVNVNTAILGRFPDQKYN